MSASYRLKKADRNFEECKNYSNDLQTHVNNILKIRAVGVTSCSPLGCNKQAPSYLIKFNWKGFIETVRTVMYSFKHVGSVSCGTFCKLITATLLVVIAALLIASTCAYECI